MQLSLKLSLFALILVLFSGCRQDPAPAPNPNASPSVKAADLTLRFGLYASDQPDTVIGEHRPTLNVLEEKLSESLGLTVEISTILSRTYESGVDQIVEGTVDFSKMGPASYVLAKERNPKLSLLAQEAKGGKKIFKGIIIVHKDSELKDLKELKGKTFAFGDQQSTIGRYLSQMHLVENGLHATDFAKWEYLGRHDVVGEAVAAGTYTAGALKESTFKKQSASGLPIKQLFAFDNITKPWVARADLEPRTFEALQKALLELTDEGALKALRTDSLVASTDAEYDFVRKGMKAAEQFEAAKAP